MVLETIYRLRVRAYGGVAAQNNAAKVPKLLSRQCERAKCSVTSDESVDFYRTRVQGMTEDSKTGGTVVNSRRLEQWGRNATFKQER